jgi:dipeptidyl aminopeptidase/acylaminoacyl peptidase
MSGNQPAVSTAVAMLAALLAPAVARSAALEVYGQLPQLENVSLSPDGSRVAFVRTSDDTRVIAVASVADHKVLSLLRVGDQKLRGVEWADADHLMIITSATALPFGLIGPQQEWTQLQVYDVMKHSSITVPDLPQLRPVKMLNVISGRVMVRRLNGHTVLFVPGVYADRIVLPALVRVDLDSGHESLIRQGPEEALQWLVDADGEVVAEQDYSDRNQTWTLKVRRGERLEAVASGHEAIDFPRLVGFGPSADTLLMQSIEAGEPVWQLLSLANGTLAAPMAERSSLEDPIEDRLTHRMIGGVHTDDDAHYVFFDPGMQARWDSVVHGFNGVHVRLASMSSDLQEFIVRIDGPGFGYQYSLVDLNIHKAEPLGDVYRGISEPLEVRRLTYPAGDNLRIPAYLTLPRGREPKNLPLIVLPHGGPAARDTADFDWWSQALADQGYAVLRPNYRGSALSQRFLTQGFTQWGRKMQTDLSDGVRYLVSQGVADPARVCIVGASYGGYAALAGVTLESGVYRCAVSVAGLSDLKRWLSWVNGNHSLNNNLDQRYWDRYLGASGPNDPVLDQISPIKHIDALGVPVLLIHGKDDTVVPFEQSEVMFDALRRANKAVDLVVLKHEDHWLSRGETRLQMLQSCVAFLRAHNPPDPTP